MLLIFNQNLTCLKGNVFNDQPFDEPLQDECVASYALTTISFSHLQNIRIQPETHQPERILYKTNEYKWLQTRLY